MGECGLAHCAVPMAGQSGEGCAACRGEGGLVAAQGQAGGWLQVRAPSCGTPVLTWQQSSSSRRLRRCGWDIPLPGREPHGEQCGAPGFLPALGSSSALAVRALAHGQPCTR